MATAKPSPKHRLERRRVIPAPRAQDVRRTLARVILGADVARTWPTALPTVSSYDTTSGRRSRRDLPLAG